MAFVGPSVPVRRLHGIRGVEFRPCARRGDVEAAVDEGFHTIVLIDGMMVYSYPPSPKEVAAALDSGVQVYGAASLGALRAVELRRQGMVGCGWVYQQFLTGAVFRDDELLASFDETSGEPSTIPLIDVRYACEVACRAGRLEPVQSQVLLERLRIVYFENRTPECIARVARDIQVEGGVIEWIVGPRRLRIKQADALACLRAAVSRVK